MNGRIRQLAEQAKQQARRQFDDGNHMHAGLFSAEKFQEIFAELIVKECCEVFVELRTRPADLAALDVKRHFGIK